MSSEQSIESFFVPVFGKSDNLFILPVYFLAFEEKVRNLVLVMV